MNYRIHAWCPRCDKTADVIASIMPNPRIACHACLRDDNKTVEMKIVAAEQIEEE
jgi:hypothetical protein